MSNQYVDFITKNPLEERMLREREIKGEIKLIIQLLHVHFSQDKAELAELALRNVRDAKVIEPLKDAAIHWDEQGVNMWLKDHLPNSGCYSS
jgi:hypothetical protein